MPVIARLGKPAFAAVLAAGKAFSSQRYNGGARACRGMTQAIETAIMNALIAREALPATSLP